MYCSNNALLGAQVRWRANRLAPNPPRKRVSSLTRFN